jgi:toxin HigB-1
LRQSCTIERCTLDVQRTGLVLSVVIQSFTCAETRAIFEGLKSPKFNTLRSVLERKLTMLSAAVALNDLKAPPNSRLEALSKDRAGQHSIRVNDQFRLCCFVWTSAGPKDVECVAYH